MTRTQRQALIALRDKGDLYYGVPKNRGRGGVAHRLKLQGFITYLHDANGELSGFELTAAGRAAIALTAAGRAESPSE